MITSKLSSCEQFQNASYYFTNLILDELDCNCWIAGGSLTKYFSQGTRRGDIDIWFPNQSEFLKAKESLENKDNCTQIYDNSHTIAFSYKKYRIELIKNFFESPIETISNFDFTVCSCAIDKKTLYYHETFFIDLAKRRLVINKIPYPLSTLQRIQKYVLKGYFICNGGLLQIAKAIQTIDFNNKEENGFEFYPDGKIKFLRID